MPPASPLALPELAVRPQSGPTPRLRRASFAWCLPLALPALLLLLWQNAVTFAWVSPQVLPAPAFVWESFVELWSNGDIGSALIISLQRISIGFAFGATTGLATGIALASSDRFRAYVEPLLKAVFAVPSIGWIPILILIFGVDESLKVIIIAKAVFVPFVINTQQGIRDIPVAYREAAAVLHLTRWKRLTRMTLPACLPALFSGFRLGLSHAKIVFISLSACFPAFLNTEQGVRTISPALREVADLVRLSPWQKVTRLVLPGAAPAIFIGLEIALLTAWIGTVGAEYAIGVGRGIGSFLVAAREGYRMDLVLVGVMALAGIGYAFSRLARSLLTHFVPWQTRP